LKSEKIANNYSQLKVEEDNIINQNMIAQLE